MAKLCCAICMVRALILESPSTLLLRLSKITPTYLQDVVHYSCFCVAGLKHFGIRAPQRYLSKTDLS